MKRSFSRSLESAPASQIGFAETTLSSASRAEQILWKRSFDLGAAVAACLLLLPLIVGGVLAVWCVQGRPIFIRHRRVGKNGRAFDCFKFRTMVPNAEEALRRHLAANEPARREWLRSFKLKNDPRVTPLGRVLRKSSLDELPQLWNVLRGEMSIVGPRPIVAAEIHRYGTNIRDYYLVKPGLTGLWQVSGRSDVDYPARVRLDVEYARSVSMLRDLKIIVLTVPAVMASRGSY